MDIISRYNLEMANQVYVDNTSLRDVGISLIDIIGLCTNGQTNPIILYLSLFISILSIRLEYLPV
jgi:hypothetical protein